MNLHVHLLRECKRTCTFSMREMASSWFLQYTAYTSFISSAMSTKHFPDNKSTSYFSKQCKETGVAESKKLDGATIFRHNKSSCYTVSTMYYTLKSICSWKMYSHYQCPIITKFLIFSFLVL